MWRSWNFLQWSEPLSQKWRFFMLYLVVVPVSLLEGPDNLTLSICMYHLSLNIVSLLFLIFWMKLRFIKHKKVTKTFFRKSSSYAHGKCNIFGPKINTPELFSRLVIRWMNGLCYWQKMQYCISASYYKLCVLLTSATEMVIKWLYMM